MRFLNKILLIGASAVCLSMAAEDTMIYDLRDRNNFTIANQFSVDKDEEPWMWGAFTVGSQDFGGPLQYNSSYADGYYSSAYYTPELNLAAGTYKVHVKPRKYNSNYTTSKSPDLRILLAQGEMTEQAYNAGKMKEIGHITGIENASAYSTDAFNALREYDVEFTIETPGKYRVAFFNKDAAVHLHNTYIVLAGEGGSGSGGGTVDPDPDPDPDPEIPDTPDPDPNDPTDPDPQEPTDPSEPLATVNLPFESSFAGASFGKLWQVEEQKGKASWEAVAELSSQLPTMKNYDNDGGMAVFRGWDGDNGDYARLATAPISMSSTTAPVIEFWFGHSGARATTDKVQVQVQPEGGSWTNVEGALIATYIPEIENGGWTYYKFPLDAYVGNGATYRVGLLGLCENLNANIPVDAVRIFNAAGKDLAITELNVPEEVNAGGDLTLSLVLENKGASTIKAADYTITIDSDYPGTVAISPADIAAYSTATLSCTLKPTAEEVLNGPDYSFTAKVKMPGNASGENLTSSKVTTEVGFVDHKSPVNPSASTGSNGALTIAWESVKDLAHKDIYIYEDFTTLQARYQEERVNDDGKTENVWVDGRKGDFNGFISLDFDKMDGGSYYSTSGSEFQVFKDFMTGSFPQGHNGQYIGLTLPPNIQQDDWLISPALDAAETSLIKFWVRLAYRQYQSDNYNNSLEVLYATEDYDVKNPKAAFKKTVYTNTSKATSGDLAHDGNYHWLWLNEVPSEAKYVALHFTTKCAMATGVWIDRISITEEDQYPLAGYYVYHRNKGRLNTTPLKPEELRYAVQGTAAQPDMYYVTALYSDGESKPAYIGGNPAAVTAIDADNAGGEVKYYNLQGLEVKNPRPGEILIRVQGNKAEKVLWK